MTNPHVSEYPLSFLPLQSRKALLERMWFKVAVALCGQWEKLTENTALFSAPGVTINNYMAMTIRSFLEPDQEKAALEAAKEYLANCSKPESGEAIKQAAEIASKVLLTKLQYEKLPLARIEKALGLEPPEKIDMAISKLSSHQKKILVLIYWKTLRDGFGEPIKWIAKEHFPNSHLSSVSRSVLHLEERELIQRLPKKHLKMTELGWHCGRQLTLFPNL